MDRDDLELFERSLRNATENHTGDALDAELDALGWNEALAEDPRAAISTLFELQGRATATSSALDRVYLTGLGLEPVADLGAVWPAFGSGHPPASVDGSRAAVAGLAHESLSRREHALAVAEVGEKTVALRVETAALTLQPRPGVDPRSQLVEVTGHAADILGEPEHVRWDEAIGRCRLAVAHELQGAARTMLDLARDHALERIQFDRPISSFQAVRHRLAETLIAIESADAMVDAAWSDPSPQSASMAKALAGRSARTAARHCQQVLAGIGFTTEHPFHLSVRRVLVLDQLFGASRPLTEELGAELLRTRRLPTPPPL